MACNFSFQPMPKTNARHLVNHQRSSVFQNKIVISLNIDLLGSADLNGEPPLLVIDDWMIAGDG